ncbi:DegT/DnrJ/EryC1/StrS family aminotransferase [Microbacterium sp. TPD7012]|uniref:DegT/DnrJ/EryC1/StrS family aminotransferase n=1 Tax=Microbacterium sp. TPD7012 TaxID=2171975 RepID=UPI000D51BAA8|nr:DegT/DnrJ/EryC1/StrS family aminotransferase [Microbacterium sp. TPD7012]PVE92204.1 glutamine--scyllo-inositol aminotransferase [Microbacterium sp. TPD7012]
MRLNIPLTGAPEVDAVREVIESGYLTQGAKTAAFEEAVRGYTAARHAAAVSSATTGLHLALVALGVQPGDEVVIPGFSFPATANAVIQQGATPVFVDIDEATFNLDPALLDAAVTDRTRAIMPVHAFGLCADMDAINAVAARHELPVLEDAACALGGTYGGRHAGTLGTAGVYSFHPRKIITTAEGGMITTDDDELAKRIAVLRAHGAVRGELYMEFVEAGFNYRLSDVHAAIGLAQMTRIDDIVSGRRRAASELTSRVSGIEGVQVPTEPAGTAHTFQSYVVLLDDGIDRDEVIRRMRTRDIETTLGTYGMHLQPYFRERFGIPDEALPHTTRAHHQALTLPLYPQLTEDDMDAIADALRLSIEESATR